MQKIGDVTPTANPAGEFTEGNPAAGAAATLLKAGWFNTIQRELLAVLAAAGIAPDKDNDAQLVEAIEELVSEATPSASEAVAGVAKIATDGDFTAGTDDTKFATVKKINTWFGVVMKQATESAFGWAKVATQTQANSGVDDTTMVTPKKLSGAIAALVIQATETIAGIAKFATQDQSDAGAADDVMTSPKTLKSTLAKLPLPFASSKLKLSATGTNSKVLVSADELVVKDSLGRPYILSSISLTLDAATSGAGGFDAGVLPASTWCSVWVIWNGAAAAGLLSLSETGPTLPAGYTHKARVGWIRTDSTANKYPMSFVQVGRKVRYKVATGSNTTSMQIMASGVQGSVVTPTWVAVSTSAFVPPTATAIDVVIGGTWTANAAYQIMVAPNTGYGDIRSTSNPPPLSDNNINQTVASNARRIPGTLVLETSNIYIASAPGSGTAELFCAGWEDSL